MGFRGFSWQRGLGFLFSSLITVENSATTFILNNTEVSTFNIYIPGFIYIGLAASTPWRVHNANHQSSLPLVNAHTRTRQALLVITVSADCSNREVTVTSGCSYQLPASLALLHMCYVCNVQPPMRLLTITDCIIITLTHVVPLLSPSPHIETLVRLQYKVLFVLVLY